MTLTRLEAFTLGTIAPNGTHFQSLNSKALGSLEAKGLVVVGADLYARKVVSK